MSLAKLTSGAACRAIGATSKRKGSEQAAKSTKKQKTSESKRQKVTKPKILSEGSTDLGNNCLVVLRSAFVEQAGETFDFLKDNIAWLQQEITVMGRKVMQPREIAYFADDGLRYTYSKTQLVPQEFPSELHSIRKEVEKYAGTEFNCCLMNHYRHGKDHLGWHSDNEHLFGSEPTIASLSFGARRDFILRKNLDHSDKYQCALGKGDLLIMKGNTQTQWMHSLPKRTCSEARINLTFRNIIHAEAIR